MRAKYTFEDQANLFFLSFGQGIYIFERSPKSIEVVIGDVYCPGMYCYNREKCESLDGCVTTPRSTFIQLLLWKVWSLADFSQNSF